MNTNWLTCLLVFSLLLVHYEAADTTNFCDATVGTVSDDGALYVHDKDEYIQLHANQILLDMKTSIQSEGHMTYSWFLQINTGDTEYKLRVIKTGIRGEPVFSDTVPTIIQSTDTVTKDTINDYFLGAQSRFIALKRGSIIKFYWIDQTDSNLALGDEFTPESGQIFYKILAGNNRLTANFLTKTTTNNRTQIYSIDGNIDPPTLALNSSSSFSSSDQFIFGCQLGMLWIDGSALNQGPKLLKVSGIGIASITTINGNPPPLSNANGIHFNYDVIALNFVSAFFVAMHDENYRNSVQFFIDVAQTEYVTGVQKTVTATIGQVNSYYTDQNSNYLLVKRNTNNEGQANEIQLTFVDSFFSTRIYRYQVLGSSSVAAAQELLEDLATPSTLQALKVSYSYIGATKYYNLFIMRLTSTQTKIIRYFYDTSSQQDPVNTIAEGALKKHYQLTLATPTQNLFRQKLDRDDVQIMTFEYACTCSVTEISEFICFGASLECTVAVQNFNTDCTNEATTDQTNVV